MAEPRSDSGAERWRSRKSSQSVARVERERYGAGAQRLQREHSGAEVEHSEITDPTCKSEHPLKVQHVQHSAPTPKSLHLVLNIRGDIRLERNPNALRDAFSQILPRPEAPGNTSDSLPETLRLHPGNNLES